MRKVLSNIKGFAMAELLAVSIAVLLIFSVLFSNYLPLVVEYENRLSYNDVTAQYAAHYIRKMYKDALEKPISGEQLANTIIEPGVNSTNKFLTVFKKGSVTSMCGHFLEEDKQRCNDIIAEYGIEEVIITNYQLTDVKYSNSNGKLTNYIDYLPEYKNSPYTGANLDDNKQLYRIILKTEEYGYATTAILSDYVVTADCFDMAYSNGEFTITKYKGITQTCPKDVFIPTGRVADSNGRKGKITAIGNDAFKDIAIESIEFGTDVVSIGDSAFEGTNLKAVELANQITSVGKRAFANTAIKEISLQPGRTYDDEVFADNAKLTTVNLNELTGDIKKADGNLAKGLFANSGNSSTSGINISIPNTIQNIGEKMFYQANINSIVFSENSVVKTIGASAFAQQSSNRKVLSSSITIPSSVETIGTNSFKYLGITGLKFEGKKITTIGESAFEQDNNTSHSKVGDLTIPSSVTTLGANSFKNLGITNLTFETGISLTEISANAFEYVGNSSSGYSFSTLTIPSSVTKIGASSFKNRGIEEVNFNANLSTIGNYAFTANKIKNLNIPDSVISIGESAFSSNKELETIKLSNSLTILQSDLFNDCSNSTTVAKTIVIPDSVTQIRSRTFTNANIKSIELSENSQLKAIWNDAFNTNPNLEKFTVPNNVTSIGSRAFAACTNLGKIEGSFINNSNNLGSADWCDVFYNTNEISCNITTSGNTTIIAPIGTTGTKYVTNAGGTN